MELDTRYVHLLLKDDILIGTYKKGLHINLEIAQEIVRTRISFMEGKKIPAMIITKGIIGISKPARDYLSSKEGTEGLVASAIIAGASFNNLMGNFFLKVHKTAMPVRIFSDKLHAEKWLKKFIV
jgi:hypothetical protein